MASINYWISARARTAAEENAMIKSDSPRFTVNFYGPRDGSISIVVMDIVAAERLIDDLRAKVERERRT